MLKTTPCVFVVNDTYQIMVPVEKESVMFVKVGDKCYYDEANGVKRSRNSVHRMVVPMEELDKEKSYTICEEVLIERKPYFPETEGIKEYTFKFIPVKTDNPRAYHIADAHNLINEPIDAAKVYGEMDFLIMNGDVIEDSRAISHFDVIYEIAQALTKGEKPVVCVRGNHDCRGEFAEELGNYFPVDHGNTYYTFRLGSIWGIVLDCGEDKEDSHPEYGNMVCCHGLREKQTKFIKEIIKNASKEYLQENITTRLVVVHRPFTRVEHAPFDIEKDIFQEWAELLKENVKPHLMISGHIHQCTISYPGDEYDALGNPCPVLAGAEVDKAKGYWVGCGLEFANESIYGKFTSSDGNVLEEFEIKK